MIETRIQHEASPEFSLYDGTARIQTLDYKVCAVNALPLDLHEFYNKNSSLLDDLLNGNQDFSTGLKNQALATNAIYPQDSHGNENINSITNGIIRGEELMTFITVNPQTNVVMYLARSRPDIKNSNTPGQLDAGVFSHGGLTQAGVINAWRFVADKLSKNDPELTQQEYEAYLTENPLPKDISVVNAGQFLLSNGSNARNASKDSGKELERRTSGLLNVRGLVISYNDFLEIIDSQNQDPTIKTEYTVIELNNKTDNKNFTPKHKATHELLMSKVGEIETQALRIIKDVKDRSGKTL